MTRAAGIDVGGTKFLGVVLDEHGAIVAEQRRSTPSGGDAVVEQLAALARDLAPYDSLGVGVPGLVTRTGVLRAAPNLVDAEELAIGPRLEHHLGHPVHVDNDATCAVIAEWRHGAARGHDDVVLVTLGTGIGGGLVMGGRLHRGANGFAGEVGHMVVQPDGPRCACGRRGCWEQFASGTGLRTLAGGQPGEAVVAAVRGGDEGSRAVVNTFARWVALGLVNLTNVLDPSCIVIGGGLAEAPDVFLEPIKREFADLLYSPQHRPHPRLSVAELGEHAGAIGAALLASTT